MGAPLARRQTERARHTRSPALPAAAVMLCAFVFLVGCDRKAANEPSKTPSKETASANPAQTNTAGLIHIPAGKFVMGDKDEVDAPPHEVMVSSFLMDKYLVTQEQF